MGCSTQPPFDCLLRPPSSRIVYQYHVSPHPPNNTPRHSRLRPPKTPSSPSIRLAINHPPNRLRRLLHICPRNRRPAKFQLHRRQPTPLIPTLHPAHEPNRAKPDLHSRRRTKLGRIPNRLRLRTRTNGSEDLRHATLGLCLRRRGYKYGVVTLTSSVHDVVREPDAAVC